MKKLILVILLAIAFPLSAQDWYSSSKKITVNNYYADLSNLTLVTVDFASKNLDYFVFSGCTLNGSTFQSCSLIGTDFSNANLSGANFMGANFINTNLSGATLIDASFLNAHVDFDKTYIWSNCTYDPNTTIWIDGVSIGNPE